MASSSTLRTRILGAFALALGIVIAGCAIGAFGLINAMARYRGEVSELRLAEAAVLRIESHFKIQVQEWKNVLLRGKDPEKLDRYWMGFEMEESKVTSESTALLAALPAGQSRELIDAFLQAHGTLGEGYRKGLAAFKEAGGDPATGDKAVAGIDRAPTETLDKAVEAIARQASEAAAAADQKARSSLFGAAIAVVAALLGGMAMFAILTQRSIIRPATTLVGELEMLTAGTLFNPVHVTAPGELGRLANGIEQLRRQLLSLIGNAKASSEAVCAGTTELYATTGAIMASADAASGTAVTLAAAMEQIRVSGEQVSGNASRVAEEADQALRNVGFSRDLVERLLNDVHGIENDLTATAAAVAEFVENARNISGLTQQVREIADQTNLLALNAAIEAARAGEQGRGFAVVADEVRKLAEKSAHSASQIDAVTRQLEAGTVVVDRTINASNDRLANSSAESREVSSALEKAIDGVRSATENIGQIARAIHEQRATINGMAKQSEELARIADKNSSSVREIRTHADQMNKFASHLDESLAAFRL